MLAIILNYLIHVIMILIFRCVGFGRHVSASRQLTIIHVKMKKYILASLILFLLASCDNAVVPKADYDALVAEKQVLQAENDSLQFELSSLKMYVDYIEEENGDLAEELKSIPLREE